MRDNFVGDVGDYFKYGLLRTFARQGLRLGFLWYYFQDEEAHAENHGGHLSYLDQPAKYRGCDEALFEQLKSLVNANQRSIQAIGESGLFPADTCFYAAPLSFQAERDLKKRPLQRHAWFQQGMEATRHCDVVFLDPDNGLEIKSVNPYRGITGPKYVAYDELKQLLQQEQTLVIYQHTARKTARQTIEERQADLRREGYGGTFHEVYTKDGSGRIFFILPAPRHEALIAKTLEAYHTSPWGRFSVVAHPGEDTVPVIL